MSEVASFTQMIGVVVVAVALLLLAPRATVGAWGAMVRGLRAGWHSVRTWRPGTVEAAEEVVPVEVTVVHGRPRGDHDEVMDAGGLPGLLHALRELGGIGIDVLQGSALLLAVIGLVIRVAPSLVGRLPEPVVLGGDLLLVLGAFFVMQRTIQNYPDEWLPALRRAVLPQRVKGRETARRGGRLRHALEMVALAPAFLALLAWPTEIGRFLAEKQFTGSQATVLVVWACELPWLVVIAWFLARPLLPPVRRHKPLARHGAVGETAPRALVVPLPTVPGAPQLAKPGTRAA